MTLLSSKTTKTHNGKKKEKKIENNYNLQNKDKLWDIINQN